MNTLSVWSPSFSAAASLGGALGGAFVGGWLSDRREHKKRSADLIARQLKEFYGPLTALQASTQIHRDLLARMNAAAECFEKSKTSDIAPTTGGFPEQMQLKGDDDLTDIKDLMRIYRQMMDVFQASISVADPTAHAYFLTLCNYVDSWERSVRFAMPSQVWIVEDRVKECFNRFTRI